MLPPAGYTKRHERATACHKQASNGCEWIPGVRPQLQYNCIYYEVIMPSLKVSVPHTLGQDEAMRRLKNFINDLQAQYGNKAKNVQESWSGNVGKFSLEVMGMALSGILNIEANQVNMEANFPMAALPFKGTIESQIREKIGALLS